MQNSAKSTLLIKGGRIVNDDYSYMADVLIEDGAIVCIEESLAAPKGAVCIDATGKLILPGAVDSSTHFDCATQLPFRSIDDFQTGTKAAISGGTTLVANSIEPSVDQSYLEVFDEWQKKCENSLWCDCVIQVGLSWWSDEVEAQVECLVKEKGVASFYIPLRTTYNDEELIKIFHKLKSLGAVLHVYPYNHQLVQLKCESLLHQGMSGPEAWLIACSEDIELQSIHHYIILANQVGLPLFINSVTNTSAAQLVAMNRAEGKNVFCSMDVASLVNEESKLLDADWKVAAHHLTLPPNRYDQYNSERMIGYLANSSIQAVCSEHRSFTTEQKAAGKDNFCCIPAGVASVQEMVQALWGLTVGSGKLDACCFASLTSSFPAKLFNLYPKKGRIGVGSDADVIIMDTSKDHEFNNDNRITKSDFNVFEGLKLSGKIDVVIKSGVVVEMKKEEPQPVRRNGAYIRCQPFSDVAYGRSLSKTVFHSVVREPYAGPVSGVDGDDGKNKAPSYAAGQRSDNFCRPPTKSGGRNMQDTTLSISVEGTYADDPVKCQKLGGYRVNQPPGGRTTQFW
ncbi:hypothetical protein HELRODRAFT_108261 [Helobdella robusta]|uniref:dihydropyrimidinase n=1 Tax=Helobdella robusta TaxID=6412 RepID=T1EEH7_HELRO|nr:hypothetical protein HELRODRAFT_108261 [Helobdella robusta]ESN93058.1 hypothetical protein HELRODRAFT_108261 [Helobdella robusta]